MTEPNNISGRRGVTDTAASEIADVSKSLIGGITPADKGWILGFIVVVFIIVASYTFISIRQAEQAATSAERLTTYLIAVESNRSEALERQAQFFGDQARRSQEVIRELAQAVARDSERAGIAALTAIEAETAIRTRELDKEFIGPPTAEQVRE